MTTHELAKLLLSRPDEPVLVEGYEGGSSYPTPRDAWFVLEEHRGMNYSGPHGVYYNEEDARSSARFEKEWMEKDCQVVKGILLSRSAS